MSKTAGYTLMIIAGMLVCVGLWFGYWQLAGSAQSHEYQVNTHSQQYQSGIVSQERNLEQGWYATNDPAQKQQIASQFCAVYPSLNPAPVDLAQANSTICQ